MLAINAVTFALQMSNDHISLDIVRVIFDSIILESH